MVLLCVVHIAAQSFFGIYITNNHVLHVPETHSLAPSPGQIEGMIFHKRLHRKGKNVILSEVKRSTLLPINRDSNPMNERLRKSLVMGKVWGVLQRLQRG